LRGGKILLKAGSVPSLGVKRNRSGSFVESQKDGKFYHAFKKQIR
jgi:hypothetical protein